MKLLLRSWGGFTGPAGATLRSVDLDALPEGRGRRGRALADAAHLFDRPPKMLLSAPHPWDFNYLLEVEDGARRQQVQLHLEAVDESLRTLVQWIEDESPPVSTVVAP